MSRISQDGVSSVSPLADVCQISDAAQRLAKGELVAFPTETVYGLGADAGNPDAVSKIYTAKGRPSDHPVIVHVASPEQARHWAREFPPEARILMSTFWPGPLTLILRRAGWVDPCVSGGQDTIGLRCPSHPVAQDLLQAFARLKGDRPAGVAAPSANRFGHVSPTTAAHVREEFHELVAQGMPVLEGGAAQVGIESTIVDLSRLAQGGAPALLRPGSILPSDIEDVLGVQLSGHEPEAPRVSGSLKAHYSPDTPMRLIQAGGLVSAIQSWCRKHPVSKLAVIGIGNETNPLASLSAKLSDEIWKRVQWYPMPSSPAQYAQMLYARLREMDHLGVDEIFWEDVPETEPWAGVRDRLQRAAAAF